MRVLLIDSQPSTREARGAVAQAAGLEVRTSATATGLPTSFDPQAVLVSSRGSRDELAEAISAVRGQRFSRGAALIAIGEGLGQAMTAYSSGADDFWEEPLDAKAFEWSMRALQASRLPVKPTSRRPLILVADDDRFFRERTAAALQDWGCDVEAIGSGSELLRRLERAPRPALLVIDVFMPGAGGHEVLTRLRETPAWSVVPTIVMSAVREDPAIESELKRLGARAFIPKTSTDLDTLVEVVRQHASPPTLVRRTAPRVPTWGLAHFRESGDQPWRTGFVYNLGPTGAFLRTTLPATQDAMVQVRLTVPPGDARIATVARVAWSRNLAAEPDDFFGMGLQFHELSREALRALEDLIALHPVDPLRPSTS